MDKNVNIEELRAAEKRCWKDEERHQKALHTSANAAIQAYLDGNRSAIQAVSDEEPEIPQDPKGRTGRRSSKRNKPQCYHTEKSAAKNIYPAKVADAAIKEYLDGKATEPEEAEVSGKKVTRSKKGKVRDPWAWGTSYRERRSSRKADKSAAKEYAEERRKARAQKGKDNAAKSAQRKAAQAKAAAEREEARMSHEPIKFTGATDVAAQTHGKKKAGRLPSRGRRA